MKIFAAVLGLAGFMIIIGTAGSSDFYEECRAAADCVAGEPMSTFQMTAQLLGGLAMLIVSTIILADN
jgi:hypothetical protein